MREFSLGRRRFTIGAAAAAATAALIRPEPLTSEVQPQQAQAPAQGSLEQQTQAALAKLSPQSRAEVEMKVNNIFRKYGDRLSPEQKADIRKVMADGQEGLDKMRAFALANSDQPATVFVTFRKNGRK